MKRSIVFAMLVIAAAPVSITGAPRQNKSTKSHAPRRNLKLEQAAASRFDEITPILQPEAKTKLTFTSKTLIKALWGKPSPKDPGKIAQAVIGIQFKGLNHAQSDLLTFYATADVARFIERILAGEDIKDDIDSMSELGEMESLRLQMAMDRVSKFMTTLSNLLKKIADTDDTIVQNLK